MKGILIVSVIRDVTGSCLRQIICQVIGRHAGGICKEMGRSVGWPVGRSVGRPAGRSVGLPVGWSAGGNISARVAIIRSRDRETSARSAKLAWTGEGCVAHRWSTI